MDKDNFISKLNGCITCETIKNNSFVNVNEDFSEDLGKEADQYSELSDYVGKYENESFEDYEEEPLSTQMTSVSSVSNRNMSKSSRPQKIAVNKTFSALALRDIERQNKILMQKILSKNRRKNEYTTPPKTTSKLTTAAVNRRKNLEKIAHDNQILLRKIQSVKSSV